MSFDPLRAPFHVDAIKVKPQSVNQEKTKGLVTYYIDARLVAERLNEVVGNDKWSDEYRVISGPSEGTPVECRLTVNGVTKTDVGQVSPGDLDEKSWKSSYSDAFKRAAVKFGVGAYLYDSPNIWAEVKVGFNGKVQGFSDAGRGYALQRYEAWISGGTPDAAVRADGITPAAATTSPRSEAPAGASGGFGGNQAAGAGAPQPPAATNNWTWPFGKHKGKLLDETPPEYLDWFLEKSDKQDIKDIIVAFRSGAVEQELAAVGATQVDPFEVDSDIPFDRTIDGLGG